MQKSPLLALTLTLPFAIACGSTCRVDDPDGVRARIDDPSKPLADFLAHPWPSDARLRNDGSLDLAAFPNPTESTTLEDYLRIISAETKGFATSAALYASFTGELDLSTLPADPAAAMQPGSSLFLVDVDPRSPERGRRYPLVTRFVSSATLYLPAHNLTVIPPFGVPLRGGTTYALVATKALRAADGGAVSAPAALTNALDAECTGSAPAALASVLAPLRAWMSSDASAPKREDVVLATVFTTQDAVGEIRALASAARAEPVPVIRDLRKVNERRAVVLYHGEVDLPSFQSGKLPYAELGDGGELVRDASGGFTVDHHETSRFSLSLPKPLDGRVMPEAGWPVVIFSHGTGGSFSDALDEDVADALGREGIAVVGYDQTLHGPRDPTESNPELTFFNLFNPIAARDNIRQGAADLVTITNVLANGLVAPASVTGQGDVRLDPARIGFLGHSQGALVGAPFLSAESRIQAVTFSGLGAILTITLLERKDIVDFEGLLASLLFLPESEPLEELHPVLNLIQTFIEVSDPIAYARSYVEDPAPGAAFDILHVEGMKDFASPPRGQEAFATAAHIPLVAPEARRPAAAVIVGLDTIEAPVSANITAPNGALTMGLIQYPDDTHFPIYDNADANRRYVELLRSSLWDGRGRIVPAQ